MATPLTGAERASCHECMRSFWAIDTTATVTNGFGIVMTLSDLDKLQADIDARLNTISADDTACTKVRALVAQWDAIATASIKIVNGNIGGSISGVSLSSDDIKAEIREVLGTYLHVYHQKVAIGRRNAEPAGGGRSFGISR